MVVLVIGFLLLLSSRSEEFVKVDHNGTDERPILWQGKARDWLTPYFPLKRQTIEYELKCENNWKCHIYNITQKSHFDFLFLHKIVANFV